MKILHLEDFYKNILKIIFYKNKEIIRYKVDNDFNYTSSLK